MFRFIILISSRSTVSVCWPSALAYFSLAGPPAPAPASEGAGGSGAALAYGRITIATAALGTVSVPGVGSTLSVTVMLVTALNALAPVAG
jgi:hypothetical protein